MKNYKAKIEIETKQANQAVENLSKEVRELDKDLDQVNSTQQFTQERAEKLAERMGHATRAAAGLAGGFEAIQGVMVLLGKESEDFEKVMRRVAGAMAFANGLGALADGFESIVKIMPVLKKGLSAVGKLLKGWPGILLAAGSAIAGLATHINKTNNEMDKISKKVEAEFSTQYAEFLKFKILYDQFSEDVNARRAIYEANKEAIDSITGATDDFTASERALMDNADKWKEYMLAKIELEVLYGEAKIRAEEIAEKRIKQRESQKKVKRGGGLVVDIAPSAAYPMGQTGTNLEQVRADNYEKQVEQITAEMDPLNELIAEQTIRVQELAKSLGILKTEQGEVIDKTVDLKKISFDYNGAVSDLIDTFDTSLPTQIEKFETLYDTLESLKHETDDLVESTRNLYHESEQGAFWDIMTAGWKGTVNSLNGHYAGEDEDQERAMQIENDKAAAEAERSKYAESSEQYRLYTEQIMAYDDLAASHQDEIRARQVQAKVQGIQDILDISTQAADAVGSALGSIASNYEVGSKEYKRIKIAEAIISMLSGSLAALNAGMQAGFPLGLVLGPAMMASTLATGAATIAQIKQTQPGGGSIPTPSTSSLNYAASTPTISTHMTNQEPILEQLNKPQRVYVVEEDIKSTGERVSVAESESRF